MELLIAGGQLDPNIGRVLRRVLERRLAYVDVLVGPGVVPVVSLEYPQLSLKKLCIRFPLWPHRPARVAADIAPPLEPQLNAWRRVPNAALAGYAQGHITSA